MNTSICICIYCINSTIHINNYINKEQIAYSVERCESSVSPSTKELIKDSLLRLRGVAIRGKYDRWGYSKLNNHWLPDQERKFSIDDNLWVSFKRQQVQHQQSSTSTTHYDEYIIAVHTTHALGLKYLLKYHNNVVKKYEQKLASKFNTTSHVFKFEEYDEKKKEIHWTINEFSSARKLKHVWFKEKEVFIKAYKNFLYNKDAYDELGDPYTFSMLLHGAPGCGKTSLLKSLINYDKTVRNITTHLFVIPFGKIENVAIFEKLMLDKIVMKTVIDMDRRIYVFEDFDANDQADVFNIRDALKSDAKLNRNYKDKVKEKAKEQTSETVVSKEVVEVVGADGKTQQIVQDNQSEEKKDEKEDKDKNKDSKDGKGKATSIAAAIASIFDDDDKKKSNLSLTDILNCLDGICERTGI